MSLPAPPDRAAWTPYTRQLERDAFRRGQARRSTGVALVSSMVLAQVADEVCFLHGGRVHERGTPEQVLGDPVEQRTRDFLRRLPA